MMAIEQIMNKAITKAVAEATRVAIQAMAEAQVERMHDTSGPRIGGPTMKQPMSDWNAEHKYNELNTFKLKVKMFYLTTTLHRQIN